MTAHPGPAESRTGLDIEGVKLLIREGEGLAVEFKERYTPRIDEDLVAFANARGGTLLLGVRDDGTIGGERLTNDLKAKVNSLARNCKPALHVETSQIGDVVAVEVPEGAEKPYGCGSGYYRRLNGSTQKMNHDEIRLMFRESDPLRFEDRPAKGCSFIDVSRAKILAFTKEAGVSIGRTPAADFLRSLGVAAGESVTNAGVMFFAKDVHRHLSQVQITLVAFKGVKKLLIYDRRDVRDDLLTQFNEAIAFLMKHLNVRSEIVGVNRRDIYEIPVEVLREAVVNALMHRDYSIAGSQISVEVYEDRVEIVSPGGLVKGMSHKSLGSLSLRRNETIADLFFRLHKVERLGMGVQKMREAMAEAGLREPGFEVEGFFRAVFYRPAPAAIFPEQGTIKGTKEGPIQGLKEGLIKGLKEGLIKGAGELPALALKILDRMRADPAITSEELAKQFDVDPRTIRKSITKLKQIGLVKRVGSRKAGRWEVGSP